MNYNQVFRGVVAGALGLAILAAATPASADDYVKILQGWSSQQKVSWYTRSQGSRLIPLDWLRALEQPGSDQLFLDAAHIEKFRYLANSAPGKTGLPVGFAIDTRDDSKLSHTQLRWKPSQTSSEKWVGMNCAACHTAEITYQSKRMRIEGGPTLADFQGFIDALNKALRETRSDPNKAKRFAEKILKAEHNAAENTAENRRKLDAAVAKLIAWQDKVEKANLTPLAYGFGRLDAFGHIYNKVALVVEADEQTFHASNAPVSYPFMWNVPQHDKVQWNGIVSNTRVGKNYDIGALGRNIGEVTGVFADVSLQPRLVLAPRITTSADVNNLHLLEDQLRTLRPPLWPTGVLGKLDQKLRDQGKDIFIDDKRIVDGRKIPSCESCHKRLARNNLDLKIDAKMTPLKEIGTDIWMACNAVTHEAKTGVFKTILYGYLPFLDKANRIYDDRAPMADLLRTTVIGSIWAQREGILKDIAQTFRFPSSKGLGSTDQIVPSALPAHEQPVRTAARQNRRNQCLNGTDPLLAYKGRPLTGIWATAPYLHNGSVPTLYDLLLAPDQRPKSFAVGTREFDPVRVGFVTRAPDGTMAALSGDNSFPFQTRDDAGRVIDGNSNAGHDYGNAAFKEAERWALVEYMKGL